MGLALGHVRDSVSGLNLDQLANDIEIGLERHTWNNVRGHVADNCDHCVAAAALVALVERVRQLEAVEEAARNLGVTGSGLGALRSALARVGGTDGR